MAIRPNPAEPYNAEELALIQERQQVVRDFVNANLDLHHVLLDSCTEGSFARSQLFMLARAAMHKNGLYCLHRKTWREIAHEMRFPSSVYAYNHNRVTQRNFAVTEPVEGGKWKFAASALIDVRTPAFARHVDVLHWLGRAGGQHGYVDHHDPHWSAIGLKERIGDQAVRWDRTSVTGWEAESEDRYEITTALWPTIIGAAWKMTGQPDALLTFDGTQYRGEAASEYLVSHLEGWASPRAFFDAVDTSLAARVKPPRELLIIGQDGLADASTGTIAEPVWTDWKFTQLQAALVEGNSLTGY